MKESIKKTIDNAIEERYARFDELWLKATGHTFRDDEEYENALQEIEMRFWNKRLEPVLKKYGFKNQKDYYSSIDWETNDVTGQIIRKNSIKEIDEIIWSKPNHSSLYPYEKYTVDEARRIALKIYELGGKEWLDGLSDSEDGVTIGELEEKLKESGFKFDDGHSGNSFGMAVTFGVCLVKHPEKFKYMHGALCHLVGDEGYHDDRKDVKEAINANKEKKE